MRKLPIALIWPAAALLPLVAHADFFDRIAGRACQDYTVRGVVVGVVVGFVAGLVVHSLATGGKPK